MHKFAKYIKDKKILIGHILVSCIILLFTLLHIQNLNGLSVLNDEFGYWGVASSMVGYDWTPLISQTPYYSFGYSLWLALVMYICKNPIIMYKLAIVLNALFLIGAYFCCLYSAKRICHIKNQMEPIIISGLVVLFSANLFQAQIAWSETLLVFLMWLAFALFVSLEERVTWVKIVVYFAVLGYMYMVHQRTIGIIGVGIVLFFILVLTKKYSWSYFIIPLLILGCVFVLQVIVKQHMLDSLWKNSILSSINNVGLNADTVKSIWSSIANEILWLVKSLGGKIFELIVSSGYMVSVAVVVAIRACYRDVKDRKIPCLAPIFAILSLLAMLMICTIQTKYPGDRLDMIVYSRYMDNAIGPVLLIGIYGFINESKKRIAGTLSVSCLILIFGVKYIKNIMVDSGSSFFNTTCSPVIGAFFNRSKTIEKFILNLCIFIILLLAVLLVLNFMVIKKVKFVGLLTILGIYWIVSANISFESEASWRNEVVNNTIPLVDEIKNDSIKEIYYLQNSETDGYSRYPKFMQYYLQDKTINVITYKELKKIEKERTDIWLLTNIKENRFVKGKYIDCTDFLRLYKY